MPMDYGLEGLLRSHAVQRRETAQQLPIGQTADRPHLIEEVEIVNECLGWSTLHHGSPRGS
jgi:hypothetical protein